MPKTTVWTPSGVIERDANEEELGVIEKLKTPRPLPPDLQAQQLINQLPAETRAFHYDHITKIRSALKEQDYEVIPHLLQKVEPRNEQEGQALQQLSGILNGTQ